MDSRERFLTAVAMTESMQIGSIIESDHSTVIRCQQEALEHAPTCWMRLVENLLNDRRIHSVINVPFVRSETSLRFNHQGHAFCITSNDPELQFMPISIPKRQVMIAIGGLSGAGKTTIRNALRDVYSGQVIHLPTHTTRSMRDGEYNGADYIFWEKDQLSTAQQSPCFGNFIEARGNWYWIDKFVLCEAVMRDVNKLHLMIITQTKEYLFYKRYFPWINWIWLNVTEKTAEIRLRIRGDVQEAIDASLAHNRHLHETYDSSLVSMQIGCNNKNINNIVSALTTFIETRKRELHESNSHRL